MATQRRVRLGRRPGNRDTRGEILAAARVHLQKADSAAFHCAALRRTRGSTWRPSIITFTARKHSSLRPFRFRFPSNELVAPLVVDGTDGLGERLVRRMLSIWESDLQASLVASLRTAVAKPATTHSMPMQEFLTVEVLGQVLQTLPYPARGKPATRARRLPTRRADDGPLHPQAAGPG